MITTQNGIIPQKKIKEIGDTMLQRAEKSDNQATWVSKTFLDIPLEVRLQKLDNPRTLDLKNALPPEVWADLMKVYLEDGVFNGNGEKTLAAQRAFNYITANSRISPEVARRPSDADPFQLIYRFEKPDTALDEYYVRSDSATAIHLRMIELEDNLPGIIRREIKKQGLKPDEKFIILDVGSGPGDAIRKALRKEHHQDLRDRVIVHCVDPDERSINRGQKLVNEDGLTSIFQFHTMTMNQYTKQFGGANAHLMLVIGLLCPATSDSCIEILSGLIWHSRPGGIVIYSTVQIPMIETDPFLDVYMRILGWYMDFKTDAEAERVGRAAGWLPESFFYERMKFNRMTIARFPS